MKNLEREIRRWNDAEFPTTLVDAPQDAVSFDKILVIYLDDTKKYIRQVSFYNSRMDKIIATF
jgi:hypothetical protein